MVYYELNESVKRDADNESVKSAISGTSQSDLATLLQTFVQETSIKLEDMNVTVPRRGKKAQVSVSKENSEIIFPIIVEHDDGLSVDSRIKQNANLH